MRLALLISGLTAFLLCGSGGCAGARQGDAEGREEGKVRPPNPPLKVVAPDRCRLVCTVVTIEGTKHQSGPCSKAPCFANVRIDSILGYGFSFPPVLATGQTLRARFVFTTERSDLYFPALQTRYPGVHAGTRFKADAELSGSADDSAREPGLVVDEYAVQP